MADNAALCGIPQGQVTVCRHVSLARNSGTRSDRRAKAADAWS
ncbi:hypothetical protein [Streptomyces sp. NEAU-W12]|nr:hypothetical protein [Streptomyces sp. NEAU-W12]MCX2925255.1 hypothetical protein [Streptomyces sp. NEAU-W12]